MSANTLPPPPPAVCLTRSYASREIKGGTVIAEDVRDLETHRAKLLDPDEYRCAIGACRACGSKVLHALCFRERVLRGAREEPAVVETIRLYRCAVKVCGAVFTVLPAVIARHLWRLWETVEGAAGGRLDVPRSTWRRWQGRLGSSSRQIIETLTSRASSLLSSGFRSALGRIATRGELVEALRRSLERALEPFAPLSAWIHRLEPGIRLM
jgi:hypothetical protein